MQAKASNPSVEGTSNIRLRLLLDAPHVKRYATSHTMPKSGIKIVSETPGTGPELKKGDRVRLRYDIQLNHGDFLARDRDEIWTV
jgi:hypothetical protein